jgi:tetratricopeptide (TPR) repeat protein
MAATKTKSAHQKTAKSPLHHEEHGLKGSVDKVELFYQKNAKIINIIGLIIIVLIGGYFGYKNLYIKPREKKAVAMVFKAQQYFAKDSFRLALQGDGNNYGYLQVISRYGGTKVGQTARYSAGVCYIRMGQYQKGIDYLKKFDAEDKVVQAMAYGLMGDAYMELGKTAEGIRWYKEAANYNENDLISPLYLFRAGLASEKAGKTKDAITIFTHIKNKYPLSAEGRDMDKYLARLGVTQ